MVSVDDQAFTDWHPGEQAVQKRMRLPERVGVGAIVSKLPDSHRVFHSTRLHYVSITTLDARGRPWASILCAAHGMPGFVRSPTDAALHVHAHVWAGDPIVRTLADATGMTFVSGMGLEPSTRRRNKFGGHVSFARFDGRDLTLALSVSQALGLCPKYINSRELEPYLDTVPSIVHDRWRLIRGERLPDDVIAFVHQADTAYLATSYVARPEDAAVHPSRVGTNHRGGRPGFVRVLPRDGRTLVLPNYTGNRMMNSLGNIFVTPLAGIVFPCFSTGTVLYVTGNAETLFGKDAQELMPGMNTLTTIYATGYALVADALPLRERPGTVALSPYCPPIAYLAEELPSARPQLSHEGDIPISLVQTRVHNDTLATFIFRATRPLEMLPAQNAVLDLARFVRQHATPDAGTWAQSDDCVRTWTVSVPPTRASPMTFGLTIRLVQHGLVTPLLHQVAQGAKGEGKGVDVSALGITARLRGVGGTLLLPGPRSTCDDNGGRRLLWVAGGIGLTPFLGLTHHVAELAQEACGGVWDVVLAVSTREPEVMVSLVHDACVGGTETYVGGPRSDKRPPGLTMAIHLFTHELPALMPTLTWPGPVSVTLHVGRIDREGSFFESVRASERDTHICGPLPFIDHVMSSLTASGVDPESVLRERFTY